VVVERGADRPSAGGSGPSRTSTVVAPPVTTVTLRKTQAAFRFPDQSFLIRVNHEVLAIWFPVPEMFPMGAFTFPLTLDLDR
jgi:hypothetical protein